MITAQGAMKLTLEELEERMDNLQKSITELQDVHNILMAVYKHKHEELTHTEVKKNTVLDHLRTAYEGEKK